MQNPMVPYFQHVDVPGRAFRGNRYTDTHTHTQTHRHTTVITPLAHARQGLIIIVVEMHMCILARIQLRVLLFSPS